MIAIDIAAIVQREVPADRGKIARLCQSLRAGEALPPVEVMVYARSWNNQPRFWLLDGHHRVAAHRAEGRLHIAAQIVSLNR